MDAHDPYLPPAEYKKMFITDYKGKFTGDICGKMSEAEFIKYILPTMKPEDWHYVVSQYDGAIKYIDDQIGRIVKNLKNNDGFNNTIIIVTSDHGELFGEYNLATHHLTLSEEETHTPLIVHFPNAIKTPAKVKSLSRIIDIYPTLRDMIGFKMPDNVYMEGVPLIDFSGKPTVGATYVPMILYKNAYKASVLGPAFRRNLFSYRNQEWKYIFPDIDKDLNRASISKDIFRPEQIEEQLFKIDSNGRPEKKVTQKKEIMYEMYSSLFKWREIIKKEKPHLGNSKVSRKLIRELTDGNYIRPYNTY
jgi:arylsulfatase A-like enzyme